MKPYLVVIDDDPLLRTLLCEHLAAAGFEAAGFAEGRSALIGMVERRPALVILDVEMAPPNGMDVLRRLRGSSWGASLPVMMLTGRRQPGQIMEAMQLGASDYLVKPVDPATLAARVRRLLGPADAAPSPRTERLWL